MGKCAYGIEYIDHSLVHEKGFEEKRGYGCSFSKDEECCIEPGACSALEEGEEGDLWKVREREE